MRARGLRETSCTVSTGPKTRRQLAFKRSRWYRVLAAMKLRLVVLLPYPLLKTVLWYCAVFFFFFFLALFFLQEECYESLACEVSQYQRRMDPPSSLPVPVPACSCLSRICLCLVLEFHMLVGKRMPYRPDSATAVLLVLIAVQVSCKQSGGVALQQQFLVDVCCVPACTAVLCGVPACTAVLCCVPACTAVSCCAVLCHVVPCHTILSSVALCCAVPAVLCRSGLDCVLC